MNTLKSKIAVAFSYLRYLMISRHRKGHGVHSPFVFDFVSKVIFDKTKYPEYDFFNKAVSSLKKTNEKIQVEDLGENTLKFRSKYRQVNDLVSISSIPPKYGKLLFRISRYFKPNSIIELGTSVGISSIYLAKGSLQTSILTIEGNENLCDFAGRVIRQNQIKNVKIKHGNFDEALNDLPDEYTDPQLVFIDGNHKYEPTLRYYSFFKDKMKEGFVIIDDIYWSSGMRKAWRKIVDRNQDHVTIDLFRMGILIIRKSITPGHYVVRF
jgi:predicted O-methyltransferase YrrM